MVVRVERDALRDLTTFTVEGETHLHEQLDAFTSFYGDRPTPRVLWDFRRVQGVRLSADDLKSLVAFLKQVGGSCISGRTALLAATDLDFGLSRLCAALAELERLPWEMQAFRVAEEAELWLAAWEAGKSGCDQHP